MPRPSFNCSFFPTRSLCLALQAHIALTICVSQHSAAANLPLQVHHVPTAQEQHTRQDESDRKDSFTPRKRNSNSATPERSLSPEQRASAVLDLRALNLRIPLDGFDPEKIKGSFYERRGSSMHEASDMLAPRNSPIHAVSDGKITRLFLSRLGGTTIYQYDPTDTYVFYYAHLERYADNLKEGDTVRRGDVIGYVGTSGNAPPNTPHLHFSISVLGKNKRWWQASPVDPYEVFRTNFQTGSAPLLRI